MSTAKQTDANRCNAKSSTGPRTAQGKAASSQNALKTGIEAESLIIRGESRPTLEALTARYVDRFQPSTPEQSVLVDALISADWLLRRLRKVEPQLWEIEFKDAKTWDRYHKDVLYGDAFGRGQNDFNRLQRRLDSMERSYHRALAGLRALRPDCFRPTNRPPAAPPEPITPFPPTEIGFVPQDQADARHAQPEAPPPVPKSETARKNRPKGAKAAATGSSPATKSAGPTPEVAQAVPPAHPHSSSPSHPAAVAANQSSPSTHGRVPNPIPKPATPADASNQAPAPTNVAGPIPSRRLEPSPNPNPGRPHERTEPVPVGE